MKKSSYLVQGNVYFIRKIVGYDQDYAFFLCGCLLFI